MSAAVSDAELVTVIEDAYRSGYPRLVRVAAALHDAYRYLAPAPGDERLTSIRALHPRARIL